MKRLLLVALTAGGLAGCGSDLPTSSSQQVALVQEPTAVQEPAVVRKAAAVPGASVVHQSSVSEPAAMSDRVIRNEQEWRERLTPEQYHVLREKGTERPYVNLYDKHFLAGTYACAACGQELFDSSTKFNSGCGWPAFYAAKAGDRVQLTPDRSHGMVRTEVTCSRCGSHLGHIFEDAPRRPPASDIASTPYR